MNSHFCSYIRAVYFMIAAFIAVCDRHKKSTASKNRMVSKELLIDDIDQLEDELSDFIAMVRRDYPDLLLIIGEHSSGGVLTMRFPGGKYGQQADAYLLLSPWLKYNAPAINPIRGEWARPYTRRIIRLTRLNIFLVDTSYCFYYLSFPEKDFLSQPSYYKFERRKLCAKYYF